MTLQQAREKARRAQAEAWAWTALYEALRKIVENTARGIRYPDSP